MTMIRNLPAQLAGGARLQMLEPSWSGGYAPTEAPNISRDLAGDEAPHGYLLRARKALQANPSSPLAQARLAQAAQAAGEREEAVDAARGALELALEGKHIPAAHAALVVLQAHGLGGELARLLDDPRVVHLPASLRLRAAVAAGEHAAALSILADPRSVSENSADALSLLTWLHLQRGEYREAVGAGRRAQAAGAAGVALFANLGYAHAALGELPKAIKLTRQAVALAPAHRAVGLNLVLYHKLAGETDAALVCLERLRDGQEIDVQLALATAAVMVYAGQHEQARRTLQRVRASSEWAHADGMRRAALEANLAFLRWKTGAANSHTTISSLRRALSVNDYQSLSIAYLLCNLLMSAEHAPVLASVIERLQARHDPAELAGMRMVLALLEHDAPAALQLAREWSEKEVLNANAATFVTYLVCDLEGDFAQAAELGVRALTRAPSHLMLLNNTAYALALAGDPHRAGKLLDRVRGSGEQRVEIVATRALIALMQGRVERGLDGYRRAWDLALAENDEQLADRVAANAVLACNRAGLARPAVLDAQLLQRLAGAAGSRPGSWVLTERIRRELQLQLPNDNHDLIGNGQPDSHEPPQFPLIGELRSAPRIRDMRLPPGSDPAPTD
jgi:tetratricopeptide (TPR) repeat protein